MVVGMKMFFIVFLLSTSFFSGDIYAQQKAEPCGKHPDLLLNEQGKPVHIKATEIKKRILHCEVPKLPGSFDGKGTVLLEVLITPEGTVQCAKAMHGHPVMIETAIKAMKQWTFKPIEEKGKLVAVLAFLSIYVSYDDREAKEQCENKK